MVSVNQQPVAAATSALQDLINREEVLQICYWYQGEGFGDSFAAPQLQPFLSCDQEVLEQTLATLAQQGSLRPLADSVDSVACYGFTDAGKKEAGRLFSEGFADFQRGGHGECDAGCCEDGDHSQCGDECVYHQ